MNVSTADRLIESYALISVANKRALEQLRLVLREFQAHGIVCVLLKGADLIARLYGVWGLRPMADVDLLVRERDLPAIDRIVTGLGYLPQIDGNPAYRSAEEALALDLITEIWSAMRDAGLPEVMLYLPDGSASRCHSSIRL